MAKEATRASRLQKQHAHARMTKGILEGNATLWILLHQSYSLNPIISCCLGWVLVCMLAYLLVVTSLFQTAGLFG